MKLYIDMIDEGVQRATSHPKFVTHFKDDFYYDIGDEDGPFGSDNGNDTLHYLEEYVQKDSKNSTCKDFPKKVVKNDWDLPFYNPLETVSDDMLQVNSDMIIVTDQVTVAVGFGSIKIFGTIEPELKQMTLASLNRLNQMSKHYTGNENKMYQKQIEDLTNFC